MIIISAYQPYFAPFPGFFQKALGSDILVLMDAVQFPRGTTWLNRNRLKNDQGTLWLTIPVWKKGLGLQKINDVKICHDGRWAKKHLASLKTAYGKAPFFEEHMLFLEGIFSGKYEKLIELNLKIIEHLMNQLRIPVKIQLLSELDIDANEPQLSLEVCKKLGASHFFAQSSAKKYLDKEAFQQAGVELKFFNPRPLVYPQLWGAFIPNLSTFDLIFNCGPKAHTILKGGMRGIY
ncbi:MAG: WbqC family protein [Deltaproteobacteria bacterium]|nr:WbqC family protein [Deltaproteobacteria bacterium]